MSEHTATVRGEEVATILFVVFIVLKAAGLVTWSWWFVIFGPLAIMLAITLALFFTAITIAALIGGFQRLAR
jgi:hypothetical protein